MVGLAYPLLFSHTVRTLEQRLGTRLLHCTTRSVSLTESGERLLLRLSPLLSDLESILRMPRASKERLRDDCVSMGRIVKTDAMQATSVPGIFACGDMARAAGSVTFAVADGAMAGLATHRTLMLGL